MSFLTLGTALRILLFGGSFIFGLAVTAFIALDGWRRGAEILPWLALGLTASALALPALGFSLLRLGVRFQAWITPLACIALSGLPLALLTIGLYAALARADASGERPPVRAARPAGPRPYFQPVCRNPACRAPLEPDQQHCPLCGWDQNQPLTPGQPPPPRPDETLRAADALETIEDRLAYLVVRNGPLAGTNYRLGRETDIGSGPGNKIVLQDPFVASEHATIRRKGPAYVFYDMSTAGSYLITPTDKKRIDVPHTLRHGDMVQVGDTVLVFMQVE